MKFHRPSSRSRRAAVLLAAVLMGSAISASADEREDLEKLRATVLGLIDTLVKNHVIPKDKADEMMREAETRANARLAQMPPPETGPDGKKIVRVPYVPEAVKIQMHDQIKQEVLAETRNERMNSGSPDGATRIQLDGDLRLRAEGWRLNNGNTAVATAATAMSGAGLTRFPDFLGTGTGGNFNYNSQQDVTRARLRARFGLTARISDAVSGGIYLASGNTNVPASTMQTLGQNFNKEGVFIDRAFVQLTPYNWLTMNGGRVSNPYLHTDLVWADDLNLEGFTVMAKPRFNNLPDTFLTAGWYPLSVSVPNQTAGRSMLALQGGADWQFGLKENHIKLGAALYDYHGLAGVAETSTTFAINGGPLVPDYGSTAYMSNTATRGNTLFRLNATTDTSTTSTQYWGYASDFNELNLTGVVDVAQFDPLHVVLTGDLVKNLAFNRNDIYTRTCGNVCQYITDGKSLGYMGKIQLGSPTTYKRGDWNVSLSYRYLGSDAVVDAFTNADFGLGGTNVKGTTIGVNYGLDKNTWLTTRLYSSDLIDSMVPSTTTSSTPTKFSVDLLQIDLNAKF